MTAAEIISEKMDINLGDLVDVFCDIPTANVAPVNDTALSILDEVEKIILANTYPGFDSNHKPVNVWKAKEGYDALWALKRKFQGVEHEVQYANGMEPIEEE